MPLCAFALCLVSSRREHVVAMAVRELTKQDLRTRHRYLSSSAPPSPPPSVKAVQPSPPATNATREELDTEEEPPLRSPMILPNLKSPLRLRVQHKALVWVFEWSLVAETTIANLEAIGCEVGQVLRSMYVCMYCKV